MFIAHVVYSGPAFIETRYPAIEFLSGFFLCAIAVILFVFMASCLYNAKYIKGVFFSLAFALFLIYLPTSWFFLRDILHDRLVFYCTIAPKLPDNVQCVFDAIQRDSICKFCKNMDAFNDVLDYPPSELKSIRELIFKRQTEKPQFQVILEPERIEIVDGQKKVIPAKTRRLRSLEVENLWQRIKIGKLSSDEYSNLPLEKRKALKELAIEEDNVKAFVEWLFKSGLL